MDGRIEAALASADLVQLAEQAGSKLRRQGGEWRGNCPLHGGHNPTGFAVYTGQDGKQRWQCFSGDCGRGDLIDFVARWHGTDLAGALRFLTGDAQPDPATLQRLATERAERAAEALKAEIARAQAALDDLLASQRVDTFAANLQANERAQRLWQQRGIIPEMQSYWRLGFCPSFTVGGSETPTLTIPVFGEGWELRTLRHRLLNPPKPGDKYRPDRAGLGNHVFMADPDAGWSASRVLVVEGEIKAMVVYQTLDDPAIQVIGIPGKTAAQQVTAALGDGGRDVVICLDPDAQAESRSLARQVGGRVLMLVDKVDDAILSGSLDKSALKWLLKTARRQ
ncbi:MAG TPA: CHC2 zinc finger domain-containing protein [Anaerolineaceae bacterium]|nr:CHC2 zinc finger domain-containing protein [Anaerolineaceae bacterium]